MPNDRTVWVRGMERAPERPIRQLLPPIISPVDKSLKAGPLDIGVHAEISERSQLEAGESSEKATRLKVGNYAVTVQVTVERLPEK